MTRTRILGAAIALAALAGPALAVTQTLVEEVGEYSFTRTQCDTTPVTSLVACLTPLANTYSETVVVPLPTVSLAFDTDLGQLNSIDLRFRRKPGGLLSRPNFSLLGSALYTEGSTFSSLAARTDVWIAVRPRSRTESITQPSVFDAFYFVDDEACRDDSDFGKPSCTTDFSAAAQNVSGRADLTTAQRTALSFGNSVDVAFDALLRIDYDASRYSTRDLDELLFTRNYTFSGTGFIDAVYTYTPSGTRAGGGSGGGGSGGSGSGGSGSGGGSGPGLAPVPLPATAWSLLAGLGLVAGIARYRRT